MKYLAIIALIFVSGCTSSLTEYQTVQKVNNESCVEQGGLLICYDTISVNVKGVLTNAFVFKDDYYMFFYNVKGIGDNKSIRPELYKVSKKDHQAERLTYPDGLSQPTQINAVVRNDSLILFSANADEAYLFETESQEWKSIPNFKRLIYVDSTYLVTYSCAESQAEVTFTDKLLNCHEIEGIGCPLVVNKIKGEYYITTISDHRMISSQLINVKNLSQKLRSDAGIQNNSESSNIETLLDTTLYIRTSFVQESELYHIFSNKESCCVGALEGNGLKCIYQFSNVYPHFEHITEAGGQLLRFYARYEPKLSDIGSKEFGIIEISDEKILIHYISND